MILPKFTGSREEQARCLAKAMVGMYCEKMDEARESGYVGGRKAGLEALERFRVQGYAGTRNKLKGNVSRLSPSHVDRLPRLVHFLAIQPDHRLS